MESKFGSRRQKPSKRPVFAAATLAFLLGASAVGYFYWRDDAVQDAESVSSEIGQLSSDVASVDGDDGANLPPEQEAIDDAAVTEAAEEATVAAEEATEAVERVAEQQGGLDQRLAAAEQRLARLDLQAQAAAGNAARAEALLIAFATRRAVERGAELGYLADQLRLRFGDERPNAVNTIINFSRINPPIRLDSLLARLDGLAPQLSEKEGVSSWADFQRELSALFVVRRESTPSPQPERRLERARYALEQGRYQNAIDEIRGMPGAAAAEDWIADAERFRDAMAALENIETAAVLDRRGVRDGTGNLVDQRSPVEAPENN